MKIQPNFFQPGLDIQNNRNMLSDKMALSGTEKNMQFAHLLQSKMNANEKNLTLEKSKQNFSSGNPIESAKKAQETFSKKLKEVSEQFEALFVNMMFKEMRKNVGKEKLIDGGMAEEIFNDMLYQEYSQRAATNTKLGLSEMIVKQFTNGQKK